MADNETRTTAYDRLVEAGRQNQAERERRQSDREKYAKTKVYPENTQLGLFW